MTGINSIRPNCRQRGPHTRRRPALARDRPGAEVSTLYPKQSLAALSAPGGPEPVQPTGTRSVLADASAVPPPHRPDGPAQDALPSH